MTLLQSCMDRNRYDRVQEVFSGANSVTVNLCMDKINNNTVMIKTFPKSNFTKEFFENELEINKVAACRNVIKVLDDFETRTTYNLVMEAGSQDLYQIVTEEGPLNQEKFLKLFRGLTSAICRLHRHNILHNDLKLENIVFMNDSLYLIDFGLSEHIRSNNQGNNRHVGTTFYTAPEAIRDNYRSFKSDVYSYGIVMYATLTGQFPFDADNSYEYAIMQLNSQPNLKPLYDQQIDSDLIRIIESCLDKNPEQRPSMEEIKSTLWPEDNQSSESENSN